jgi:hypothetical protein
MISVTLIVDGLDGPDIDALRRAFASSRVFKTHYVVDPALPYSPSAHHVQEIRKAGKRGVEVRVVELRDILDAWCALYETLLERHDAGAVHRFSRESFGLLAGCPGLTTVAAFIGQDLVSCHLWIAHEGIVRSHLAASSAAGYASSAAYAVYDTSIRHFAGQSINLGGAAGTADSKLDGLARFKSGFANRTHEAWLLGAILDEQRYRAMCAQRGIADAHGYFPAYRAPPAGPVTRAT